MIGAMLGEERSKMASAVEVSAVRNSILELRMLRPRFSKNQYPSNYQEVLGLAGLKGSGKLSCCTSCWPGYDKKRRDASQRQAGDFKHPSDAASRGYSWFREQTDTRLVIGMACIRT